MHHWHIPWIIIIPSFRCSVLLPLISSNKKSDIITHIPSTIRSQYETTSNIITNWHHPQRNNGQYMYTYITKSNNPHSLLSQCTTEVMLANHHHKCHSVLCSCCASFYCSFILSIWRKIKLIHSMLCYVSKSKNTVFHCFIYIISTHTCIVSVWPNINITYRFIIVIYFDVSNNCILYSNNNISTILKIFSVHIQYIGFFLNFILHPKRRDKYIQHVHTC